MAVENNFVFLTVGTTSFDLLIETVSKKEICQVLKDAGYTKLLLQIGRGTFEPQDEHPIAGFTVEYYRYKDSISADIKNSSLVISHAGAGSVMESLGAGKPLVVVINEELMGNHQMELANQLYKDGHLFYCTCRQLNDVLQNLNIGALKPYKPGDPKVFSNFLDKIMGVS
ncbi:UDP-N-acetylglucosamine transferase subunit ALG13 homolog [Lineus longissimus]|uniref:UDP-N-acetylglucosamine transferase subunit ALG13 homolog n=1 Tax=Lineus longissimus TaxID=88925 RepID=UPI002B4F783B